MQMKPDEIVVRYKQAKDKTAQLKILAELNACTVDGIINILCEHGGYNLRSFSRQVGKMNQEASEKAEKTDKPEKKIPYKKPEIIAEPPKKNEPEKEPEKQAAIVPEAVIGAVEDKISELQYHIRQNSDQVKSLLEHNKKFGERIEILRAWLKEVENNENTET